MPAFVTHELFGTQVFGQLDEEIQEMLEMNPAPYFWGLQGPDLLFFRDAFFGRSVLQRYGGLMHCEKTDELFWAMSSYLNERKDTDEYETLAAYILGFVGHYCLDREAHPYVYFKQVQKERVLAADQRRGIHNRIESDIDTAFYRMKRGRSVQEYRPAKRLWGSPWEYRVIARLYQFLLEEVYGLQTDPTEVEKCFDDARRMVHPPPSGPGGHPQPGPGAVVPPGDAGKAGHPQFPADFLHGGAAGGGHDGAHLLLLAERRAV